MKPTNIFLQELWAMNHLNVAVQEKVALYLDEKDRELRKLTEELKIQNDANEILTKQLNEHAQRRNEQS